MAMAPGSMQATDGSQIGWGVAVFLLSQSAYLASALTVIGSIMTAEARTVADEFAELGGDPMEWLGRMRSARTDPGS